MNRRLLFALFMCLVLCGCSSQSIEPAALTEQHKTVYAMDTVMDLKAYTDDDGILSDAETEIKRIEELLKRSNENSEIYKINNSEKIQVSGETAYILETALNIGHETNGAFDISIAPIMDLWGFYSKDFYVPTETEIADTLKRVDFTNIALNENVVEKPKDTCIDLGGIAKGYTSDKLIDIFKEEGVTSAVISLGGNVQTLGAKPDGEEWNIGIQNPSGGYIGGIRVTDKAVITSGAYQRYFERDGKRYHHIIDPATGKSAESELSSVTIVSDSGIRADGLSTALFVMGLDKGVEYWRQTHDFDAVFVTDENSIYITEGLVDIFESDSDYEVIAMTS